MGDMDHGCRTQHDVPIRIYMGRGDWLGHAPCAMQLHQQWQPAIARAVLVESHIVGQGHACMQAWIKRASKCRASEQSGA